MGSGQVADSFGGYRTRLVEQLRANGIRDLAVLHAFATVPRHLFVPEALRRRAYEDVALPIGNGQTISQPTTQARYLEALGLRGQERVLEVGTGSGYQTALLASLASSVISVERLPGLAAEARAALKAASVTGATVVVGDGSLGWRTLAPFDGILVAAASPVVPRPLLEQLSDGGALVIPLQSGDTQHLFRITKRGAKVTEEDLGEALFVPLVGRHGFEKREV